MIHSFNSVSLIGLEVHNVIVEANALPHDSSLISIMGLAQNQSKPCRNRIVSTLDYLDIDLENYRYMVNLSPTDILKLGGGFDLPIIACILSTLGKLSLESIKYLKDSILLGEISLTGEVRPINGCLPIALKLKELGKKRLIIPKGNLAECSIISSIPIVGIEHVSDLFDIDKMIDIQSIKRINSSHERTLLDLNQVYGQKQAKRALEISAAGRHHILFYGPPGAGKTMLAQRLPTIMPPMTEHDKIEATTLYSVAKMLPKNGVIDERPYRAPHHTVSAAGLIGGGKYPFPGEISLAHTGVLFLDEFCEFKSGVLDTLRQVLEEHKVHIKRAEYATEFPASFLMIAALNPCPCGHYGSTQKKCTCAYAQIKNYISKMSGPMLDRIDMQIALQPISFDEMKQSQSYEESSLDIAKRVNYAVEKQLKRNPKGIYNGLLQGHQLDKIIHLKKESIEFSKEIFNSLKLSMRSYHKIIKISRTIADLEDSTYIEVKHIKEALMYRSFDKIMNRFYET